MDFVELGPQDEGRFVDFPCSRHRHPWTESSEYAIRHSLGWNLRAGTVKALGVVSDTDLVGLIIWAPEDDDPACWQCIVLAVRSGHQGQGIGRQLKEKLLERAQAQEIRLIN